MAIETIDLTQGGDDYYDGMTTCNSNFSDLQTQINALTASGLPTAAWIDPIWADLLEDGATPPDAVADLTVSNKTWRYRDFDTAQTEDAMFSVIVPTGATAVKYRVYGAITNATGPSAEGVAFTLAGYSVGDNDPLSGTYGTAITVTKTAMTFVQNDIFITDYSTNLTVTDLAVDELAVFQFTRDHDHASDDYGQKIGVIAVVLQWVAS